jgi:O-antigen/teichoic acid export membrane protein
MTDRLFIANMIGLPATGVYTVGYQVGSIINLLAMSFNNAYVPWLYQRLKNNSNSTKIKIVKFTYLYFFAIITLAILLAFLAPPILKILLGKSFNESSIYVSWIAMGYAFNGMYLMVVNYIFYSEKTKILAYITFSAALINILLNYLFIKAFGAIGAAQATTIVFAIKFFLVWFFSSKVQPMPWNLKKIMS